MSRCRILRSWLIAAGLLLAVRAASAQPSSILNTYVLFAQDNIRARTLTVNGGNVGVNDGLLYFRGAVIAGQSQIAGDIVHMDASTACQKLFANSVVGGSVSCVDVPPAVPKPLIADLPTACEFPPPEDFACSSDIARDVLIDHDQTVTLAPGSYRNLVVEGGGRGPAVLKLAGDYRFCNVRVGRNGSVLFGAASKVTVAGSSRVSNATRLGPDASLATPPLPGAIKWFVQGSQARFSRNGDIALHACAPFGKMLIGSGTALTGRFVARSIRMKKSVVTFAPPVPGVCGDTVLSPDEQCETSGDCGGAACVACVCSGGPTTTTSSSIPGASTTTTTLPPECETNEDCNQDSPSGGFICEDGHCVPPECDDDEDCNQGSPGGGFVCEDHHCVPGTTTTTTTSTPTTSSPSSTNASTTTTPAGTTSTTLKQCQTTADCPTGICRDGVCVPECDSDDDCMGSPDLSFVCLDGRCHAGPEVCGDCRDNDGDGLVDFEDPDCCDATAGQLFDMDLRKGRVRSKTSTASLLRLKGTLAKSGLGSRIALPGQHVGIQIRTNAGEVLCAAVPAGSFTKKKQSYRFSRKKTPVPSEIGRGLDRVLVKLTKKGQVKFRLKAKRAALVTPAAGTLRITVGFTTAGAPAAQNVCSQAVRAFRGGKGGQLRFP